MPKYGQCESEKVHVRVSVREAERWKLRTEKGEEIEKTNGVGGLENEKFQVRGEDQNERKWGER